MDIHLTTYDENLILEVDGEPVILKFWKTEECDLFKIGIKAPRNIAIAREEVFEGKEN